MALLYYRWRRWADEYLIDFNATKAAVRSGYKEKSARNTGWRLRKNEDVQAYLQERMVDQIMSADEAMIHTTRIARAPQSKAFEGEGYDMDIVAEQYADLVQKVKVTTNKFGRKVVDVVFHDRREALKTILQAHEKLEKPSKVSVEVQLGFSGVLDKVYGDDPAGKS